MKESIWYRLALILFALSSSLTVAMSIPYLLDPSSEGVVEGPPQVIIVASALAGVAGLVAAYGAWRRQKWGIWLVVILSAFNGLSALPGVLLAFNAELRASAIYTVLLALFVITVMLRRPAPAGYPPNSTRETLSPSEEG